MQGPVVAVHFEDRIFWFDLNVVGVHGRKSIQSRIRRLDASHER